jgi:formylglycine-generating enzyme required for sulfatase activity
MKILRVLAVNLIVACFSFSAFAEQRFALLIGNQTYGPKVGALNNPHNDIELVGKALARVGFNVVSKKDLSRSQMMREIDEYSQRVSSGGPDAVGFFYYSGHGSSNPRDRRNYIIPTDVTEIQDLNFWYDAVPLDDILRDLALHAPNASHIVVFDACRNELHLPYRAAGSRSFEVEKGRNGQFIAFSTSPNTVAADRDPTGTENGPYAKVLAAELIRGGQDHISLFATVKERVETATGMQRPWNLDGLPRRLYLAGLPARGQYNPADEASSVWEIAKDSTDVGFLNNFIARYKDTIYADLARDRVAHLSPPAIPEPVAKPGYGQSFRDRLVDGRPCPTCPEMVAVPAGSFMMGSSEKEGGRLDDQGPQHQVTIAKPLAIGKFSITRGEFAAFVKETGYKTEEGCDIFTGSEWKRQLDRSWRSPGFYQDDRHPVVCVSWYDAKEFTAWLSNKVGKAYRLLTEAEREYAARAKTTTRYSFGDDDAALSEYAWYWPNSGSATHPVGQKKPNAFGLFDMHGNAWAWCEDNWHPNYRSAPNDGSAWRTGETPSRVLRGGSWFRDANGLRSAFRVKFSPEAHYNDVGFRVARGL